MPAKYTLRLLSCVISPIFPKATLSHGARSSVHGRRRTFQSLIIRLFHPLPRATVPPEIRLTGEAVVTTIYLPSIKAVIEQISAVSYFHCDQYDDSRTPAPNNSVLNSVITTTERENGRRSLDPSVLPVDAASFVQRRARPELACFDLIIPPEGQRYHHAQWLQPRLMHTHAYSCILMQGKLGAQLGA